jgi:hypothetical protein
MLKKFPVATLFIFLLALGGFAQTPCKRHAEAVGGFSFCPPESWIVAAQEGQKYKIVHRERGATFTPNINVKDETTSYSLADYVTASIRTITTNFEQIGATSIKLLDQTNFTTANRTPGIRVSFRTEYKGLLIRTLQYYFNGKPGQKLIVTCTFLEEEKATLDPLFDSTLKTFQLDK